MAAPGPIARVPLAAVKPRGGGRRRAGLACAPLVALLSLVLTAATAPAQAAERTGRHLVLFEEDARASASAAAIERAGLSRAGRGAPRLGVATVDGPAAAIRALSRQPAVARVVPEYRRDFRRDPDDPAWDAQETAPRTPAGTPLQWALRRQRFPEAWDVTTGAGALVGMLDSGLDGGHAELAGKVDFAAALGSPTGPLTDEDGHGTHVSGLACAATDNGAGIAGAGFDCRLVVVKAPELRDEDVMNGIVLATDHGADAISMSFGGGPPSPAIERAIDYAVDRSVVLVAAASNESEQDQGSPGSQLQPGDAADIARGRGLVVTAADFADRRAGTGFGPQISLAAYGFFDGPEAGPPGLLSSYPGHSTPRESIQITPDGIFGPCECRASVAGNSSYAYLQGTSMAVPQVAATAALIGDLNPDLSAPEKLRILKETARRSGGWSPELGWGILDAGAALDAARRVDRTPPSSRARAGRRARLRRTGTGHARVRLSGADRPDRPALVPAGVARIDLYMRRDRGRYRRVRRATRIATVRVRVSRPGLYSFYTRALDGAGNREAAPSRRDAAVRVRG